MAFRAGSLIVRELGRMPYDQALSLQRQIHEQVLSGKTSEKLVFVEHDPVITVSRRRGSGQNLLADADELARLGIDVQETDRGGDITYHGPGQLVAYPIIRLADHGLNVGRYMRLLEQVVIDTLAAFEIGAQRIEGCTGVWVRECPMSDVQCSMSDTHDMAKIAALGVRVRRNVTMHGLAINVTTDLSHFETIIPCGLANRNVTSVKQLMGDQCPKMEEVKQTLEHQLNSQLRAPSDALLD